jgi:hypothetical protein
MTSNFHDRADTPAMPRADRPAPVLVPATGGQPPIRGSNDAEYEIYVVAAESLGWVVKSYDEWLAS